MIALFAFYCGAIVANLYYAQPITELIAPDIHMSGGTASLIVSLTQIGYAFGLFFLVPLGNLLENRKLMITTAIVSIFSLALASVTHQPNAFLAGLVAGRFQFGSGADPDPTGRAPCTRRIAWSCGRQHHERPSARHLAVTSDIERGGRSFWLARGIRIRLRIDGDRDDGVRFEDPAPPALASGYLLTVDPFAWRAGCDLAGTASSRALSRAVMFATFSLFWTAVPIELTRHYGLSQNAIALFALVGTIGATSTPVAALR